jgi:hypothetical protein
MKPFELYKKLADQGIRIFKIALNLGGCHEEHYWVHPNKTVPQWREDLRAFYRDKTFSHESCGVVSGWSSDDLFNKLFQHLENLGYIELDDAVADVYEGRVTNDSARLVDDEGFGHYGWGKKEIS